jgi:hypothetical protein
MAVRIKRVFLSRCVKPTIPPGSTRIHLMLYPSDSGRAEPSHDVYTGEGHVDQFLRELDRLFAGLWGKLWIGEAEIQYESL